MAKPTKAQIKYTQTKHLFSFTSTIRFHSVISEEHEVTSEITKFPIQEGFNVSNHAIRKNRKISLKGIITNNLIVGAEEFHEYSTVSNTKAVYATLKELIRQATPCIVNTNLGDYDPVIFTKFSTKQQAGMTDAMEFTISGEEVQLGSTVNNTAPSLLVFVAVPTERIPAKIAELTSQGIIVPVGAVLTEASCDFNESFQVETISKSGESMIMTYEKVSYDTAISAFGSVEDTIVNGLNAAISSVAPSISAFGHTIHTSDILAAPSLVAESVYQNVDSFLASIPEIPTLPSTGLLQGAASAGACAVDGLIGAINSTASDFIDTNLGKLRSTIYGGAYDNIVTFYNAPGGQRIKSLGQECLVAGILGALDPFTSYDDFSNNSLPSVTDVVNGAQKLGSEVLTTVTGSPAAGLITKISTVATDTFLGAIS